MKLTKLFIFLLGCLFLYNACQKEALPVKKEVSKKYAPLPDYDWSALEQQFFALDKNASGVASSRSGSFIVYHPLLLEAYGQIAQDNEEHHFVDSLVSKVGFPLWSKSYVYDHTANGLNLLLIPLAIRDHPQLTGLISVHKKETGTAPEYIINAMSRQELLRTETGSASEKLGYTKWMMEYEHWLFGTNDPALTNAYCTYNGHEGSGNPSPPPNNSNCTWKILEVCTDTETQTSWIAGVDQLPFHLDHDRDGILNSEDQDWGEFVHRFNINQTDFQNYIQSWWADQYEPIHGLYEDFWFQDFDDPQNWDDQWDGPGWYDFFEEAWESLYDYMEDHYDIPHDDDDDHGKIYYADDPYDDPCGGWGTPLTGGQPASNREIICNWYYLLDCGSEGDDWWDQFDEVVPCPDCPAYEDYQDLLRDRMFTYLTINGLQISFEDLYGLANDCDAFSPGFEACVQAAYDAHRLSLVNAFIEDYRLGVSAQALLDAAGECNISDGFTACLSEAFLRDIFLRSFPDVNLSPSQEVWLINHPSQINTLMEFLSANNDADGVQAVGAMVTMAMNDWLEGPYADNEEDLIIAHYPFPSYLYPHYLIECILLKQAHPEWSNLMIGLVASYNILSGSVHTVLDLCGLIPAAGEPCDLVNGTLYLLEGDGVNATLSFAATVPLLGWVATGAKQAGILIQFGPNSFNLVMKLKNGIITFGDRSMLRKVLGITDTNLEAHHVIPWDLSNNVLVQRGASSAQSPFHMNHPQNGLPLEKYRVATNPKGQHANHPRYNAHVEEQLSIKWDELIVQYGNESNIPPEAAVDKLRAIMDELAVDILDNPTVKINDLY